jgi:ABC-type bacteriocin/lantibiotic exporter with double-glycine peptidase domain
MTLEMYLKTYSWILAGGVFTFFVLAVLIVFGYLMLVMARAYCKAIERWAENKLKPKQIIEGARKLKEKIDKSFEVKKPALVKKEAKG